MLTIKALSVTTQIWQQQKNLCVNLSDFAINFSNTFEVIGGTLTGL